MTLSNDVRRFFEYLKTFNRRFFGGNVLTLSGFISIYLNYDTDYNPFRLAILNCSDKLEKEMTIDCLNFIKETKEDISDFCFLNQEDFFGKGIAISNTLNSAIEATINRKYKNLHEFMNFVFKLKEIHEDVVSFFETCFGVKFNKMLKTSQVYFENLWPEEDSYILSEEVSKFAKVIDGKREEYRLFTGDDCKEDIWGHMLKFESNNIMLIADHYDRVDKFIYNMAYEICHDVSCQSRREITLLEVDMQNIIQDVVSSEEGIVRLQETVTSLLNQKDKNKLVVYLKNYNVLLKNVDNGFSYIFYTFPILQDEEIKVIINLDVEEYKSVSGNDCFLQLFSFISFNEISNDETFNYMQGQLLGMVVYHGVYVDEQNFETALQFVRALEYGGNVDGTRSLFDFSMAFANANGRNRLWNSDFVECFKTSFHLQEKQSEVYKKLVAFHEAGHFVVSRFCKYYKAIYSDLVTVVSLGENGGMNIMETDDALIVSNDYKFYLEEIAMILAGRASEELFLKEVTAGAVSDLEYATAIATEMVAHLGLDKNNKIKGNENMKSEKSINDVSEKANKIIAEAYDLACDLLNEHAEYVRTLAEKLMYKKIMSRKEILSLEETNKEGKIYLK